MGSTYSEGCEHNFMGIFSEAGINVQIINSECVYMCNELEALNSRAV